MTRRVVVTGLGMVTPLGTEVEKNWDAACSGGREEEARAEADEVLRIGPKFSLEYWAKTIPYKNQADKDRLIGTLRKAGLK
mgnify:CR=1 FL=1